jgi:hypothetical protein
MVAGLLDGTPKFGSSVVTTGGVTNGYKSPTTFTLKEDGTTFDYTNVDLTDKWIDYTVVINGATNEQTVTATFEHNGETVTLYSGSGSTFLQPDTVYSIAGRSAERLFEGLKDLNSHHTIQQMIQVFTFTLYQLKNL